MKSMFALAALAATTTFAAGSFEPRDTTLLHFERTGEIRGLDSLRVLDSARIHEAFEGMRSKDSAAWTAKIPDSIKVKIEARRSEWTAKRDSFRTLDRKVVKEGLDSLKAAWDAKREEQIANLPAEVQEKIKAKVAKVEAKHAEIEAKIDARRAELEAKIAAKKAAAEAAAETTTP